MKKNEKSIKCSSETMSVAFHPSKDILAAGNIEGKVLIYSVNQEENDFKEIMEFKNFKKSCRRVTFNKEGETLLFSASSDNSFCCIDLEQGTVIRKITKAHGSAIYSIYAINQNIICTGDDDGGVKLWDMRHKEPVMDLKESDDCITDILGSEDRKVLLVTSGEGTLSAYDPRKHKLKIQSELMDAGLQSLAIVKNGEKVVCGGEDGVLSFFNWGEYGNISDRFPGHPYSVEKIVQLQPHLILTAASDAIRAVSVFPNRIIDIVGDHGGAPIEDLSLDHHSNFIASCSHDEHIRFWDVSNLDIMKKHFKKGFAKNKFVTKDDINRRDSFFAGLVQDIDTQDQDENKKNSEDSDDDEAGDNKKFISLDDKLSDEDSNEELEKCEGNDSDSSLTDDSDREENDQNQDGNERKNSSDSDREPSSKKKKVDDKNKC